MPPLVRSDVNIVNKLILKDGRVVNVGIYSRDVSRVREFEKRLQGHEIPHLQRTSPDGTWLGSLDAERKILWLHTPGAPNEFKVLRIRLKGISGPVKTFRWKVDGQGIIVHTDRNLWHVALPETGLLKDMTKVVAVPLMEDSIGPQIQDFRMLQEGFIVRANLRLYLGLFKSGVVIKDVTPHKRYVHSAFVGPEERIYITVAESLWPIDSQLWILDTAGRDLPSLRSIASKWEQGSAINWAAHKGWFAVARSWHPLTLFSVKGIGQAEPIKLEMDPSLPFDNVHTLWSDEKGERLLSATSTTLRVWSPEGKLLWSWPETEESKIKIYSARFTPDGASVIASLKDRVVLLKDGVIAETLVTPEQAAEMGVEDKHTFFENAQMLSDGSLAVAIVRAKETVTWREEPRRRLRRHRPSAELEKPAI
jgi:hypothetical protein